MWHRRSAAQKAQDVRHLATHYWSRMIATAGGWFCWDFSFYGNRVFQTAFISILTGGSASLKARNFWLILRCRPILDGKPCPIAAHQLSHWQAW
jgi:hypothetical protein